MVKIKSFKKIRPKRFIKKWTSEKGYSTVWERGSGALIEINPGREALK